MVVYSRWLLTDGGCFLPTEDQGAAINLAFYPNCMFKKYGNDVTNNTAVYSNSAMAYKRKRKRVVRIDPP